MSADAAELIRRLVRDLPPAPPASAGALQTVAALAEIAKAWPRLREEDRGTLDRLCQKLALVKTVHATYDPGWKPVPGTGPLAAPGWALFVGVLLAYATQVQAGSDEERRGFSLKYLNAALTALDLTQDRAATPHLPVLSAWAQDLLEAEAQERG